MSWSKEQLEKLRQEGKIKGFEETRGYSSAHKGKAHKYLAEKTAVGEVMFDSRKEAKRYVTLRYKVLTGEISDLLLQVPFELNPGGTHSLVYVADFVYKLVATGEIIVEDVKGFRTKEYRKKKLLMREVHKIDITEI